MTEEDPWVPYENKIYWFVAIGFLIIIMIFWIISNEDLIIQLLGLTIIPVILFGTYLYHGTYKITSGGMGKAFLLDFLDFSNQNKVDTFFMEVEEGLSVTRVPNTYHRPVCRLETDIISYSTTNRWNECTSSTWAI